MQLGQGVFLHSEMWIVPLSAKNTCRPFEWQTPEGGPVRAPAPSSRGGGGGVMSEGAGVPVLTQTYHPALQFGAIHKYQEWWVRACWEAVCSQSGRLLDSAMRTKLNIGEGCSATGQCQSDDWIACLTGAFT